MNKRELNSCFDFYKYHQSEVLAKANNNIINKTEIIIPTKNHPSHIPPSYLSVHKQILMNNTPPPPFMIYCIIPSLL